MVIERPLIILYLFFVAIPREKVPGQFQHIVGAAVLSVISSEMAALLHGVEKMLLIGQFACCKNMVRGYQLIEELGGIATFYIACNLIIACLSQHLWNKSVGMFCTKFVLFRLQRVYIDIIIEEACHPQISVVAGYGIKVKHGLIESSELVFYHKLPCSLVQRL